MPIYKIIHTREKIYEVIVKARDERTAIMLVSRTRLRDNERIPGPRWDTSEVRDRWRNDDPNAPKPSIEEGK